MTIHPNTPPRLAAKYKKAGSFHALAEQIKVNVSYVYDLIKDGIEPNDTTPKLREVRKRLFLKARKKARAARQSLPEHRRWWNRQDKDVIIKQLYELNCKDTKQRR
jgi:hypothetical protein